MSGELTGTELTPSEVVGRRVKSLRKSRGWSVRQLVDECHAQGFEVTSNVIENIEGIHREGREMRRRGVTVDELMALALVLDVSPLALLLPAEQTAYPITPTVDAPMVQVYQWIIGEVQRPDMYVGPDPREERTFARVALRKALPWIGSPTEPSPDHVTVYVGIGNSDDRLSQGEWAKFVTGLRNVADLFDSRFLGEWFSLPDRQWQNCEMAWVMHTTDLPDLRSELAILRRTYRQDSIALAIVAETEFV